MKEYIPNPREGKAMTWRGNISVAEKVDWICGREGILDGCLSNLPWKSYEHYQKRKWNGSLQLSTPYSQKPPYFDFLKQQRESWIS